MESRRRHMKRFIVQIKATVTKDIEVLADSVEEAEEIAEERFHVLADSHNEVYEQNVVSTEEIT